MKRKMSAAGRKNISEGQLARHRRIREQEGPRPDKKRCSKCKLVKRVPEDFPMRKRRIKSGIRVYPAGECKECSAERAAAYREKLRKDGALADAQRKWNESRDPEDRRRYQREYGRIRRALEGAKSRGPWKRYRHELEKQEDTTLIAAALVEWYDSLVDPPQLPGQRENQGLFYLLQKARDTGYIKRSEADAICHALGHPEQLAVLSYLDNEARL